MNFVTSNKLNELSVRHGFGFKDLALEESQVFFRTNQMHSDKIVLIDRRSADKQKILEADAFVTAEKGFVVYVRTADCVPILLFDKKGKGAAAVHAGWRGTALNIAGKAILFMQKELGSDPKDIVAVIGPSIVKDCFEIKEPVAKELGSRFLSKKNKKIYCDLRAMNRSHLEEAGVNDIELIDICNHCDPRFASYRRDKNETSRQVNFICL